MIVAERRLFVAQLVDVAVYVLSFWSFILHALGDWRCHGLVDATVVDDATVRGFAPHDEPALLWHSAHVPLALIGVSMYVRRPASRRLALALTLVAIVAAAGDIVAFVQHVRDRDHEHTRALSALYAALAATLTSSALTIATQTSAVHRLALFTRHQ